MCWICNVLKSVLCTSESRIQGCQLNLFFSIILHIARRQRWDYQHWPNKMFWCSPFLSFSYRIIIYHPFSILPQVDQLQVANSSVSHGRSYQSSVAKFSIDSRDHEDLKEETAELLEVGRPVLSSQATSMGTQHDWLVVWNINFIFPYIGNNHPNWLSYFSEGFKPPTRWFHVVNVCGCEDSLW